MQRKSKETSYIIILLQEIARRNPIAWNLGIPNDAAIESPDKKEATDGRGKE